MSSNTLRKLERWADGVSNLPPERLLHRVPPEEINEYALQVGWASTSGSEQAISVAKRLTEACKVIPRATFLNIAERLSRDEAVTVQPIGGENPNVPNRTLTWMSIAAGPNKLWENFYRHPAKSGTPLPPIEDLRILPDDFTIRPRRPRRTDRHSTNYLEIDTQDL